MNASFNVYYQLAKNYCDHYGILNVPRNFKTFDGITYDENGYALGLWVFNQRLYYKNHPEKVERRRLLDEVGMIYNLREINFDRMYLLACNYFAYYGNLDVPALFRTKDGVHEDENGLPLGHFITNQRYSYNYDPNYPKERIEKLDKFNMNWNIRKQKNNKITR